MAVSGKTGFITFTGTTVCGVNWNISTQISEIEVSTFCSTGDYREFITGFKEASGSFTTTECYDFLDDTGTGEFGNDDVTYSGEVIVTGHEANNPVDGRAEYTWNFRFTGPVTISCGT